MKKIFFSLLVLSLLLAACGAPTTPAATQALVPAATDAVALPTDTAPVPEATSADQRVLTVMTYDSFNVSKGVLQEFELANNVKVNLVKSGDAGAALNKAILAKDAPLADVLYGVDNSFLSRALDLDIFDFMLHQTSITFRLSFSLT